MESARIWERKYGAESIGCEPSARQEGIRDGPAYGSGVPDQGRVAAGLRDSGPLLSPTTTRLSEARHCPAPKSGSGSITRSFNT